jgi:ribosomal protein S18 acetylase RimI-like enzyme
MATSTPLQRVASTVVPSDVSEADFGFGCLKTVDGSTSVILVDVKPFSVATKNDPRLSYLVEQVQIIGKSAFWGNNCLSDCSHRNGWRLDIIAQPASSGDEVFGFVVYKVDTKNKTLHIQYIAVAERYRRHGIGSKLLKSLQRFASKVLTKSTVERIACACVPEAVEFYQKHNFRKCKRIVPTEDEIECLLPDGTIEKQLPLQFQMEWKVPNKKR